MVCDGCGLAGKIPEGVGMCLGNLQEVRTTSGKSTSAGDGEVEEESDEKKFRKCSELWSAA